MPSGHAIPESPGLNNMQDGKPRQNADQSGDVDVGSEASPTITMATVGRLAGVSQVTVSRALNKPDKVSAETLHRVREAIRLTGYVPNLTAASLASRRTKLLAAFVPSITNIIYSTLIQSFTESIKGDGYQVLLSETGFSREGEYRAVASLLSRRPDGVLLTGVYHSAECRRLLMAANLPVIEVWDVSDTPIDVCVGFSHTQVAEAVADFVVAKRFQRVAAITAGDERAMRRCNAFRDRLARSGYDKVDVIPVERPTNLHGGRISLRRLLATGFSNGVVFCSSDLLAHGVLTEAIACGISVPEELAVIGFGDQDFAAETYPALTTVRIDRSKLGSQAAQLMLQRLKGEPFSVPRHDIGFDIVERDST